MKYGGFYLLVKMEKQTCVVLKDITGKSTHSDSQDNYQGCVMSGAITSQGMAYDNSPVTKHNR